MATYVGVSVADITPEKPVPLAGFAVRLVPWEKIRDPLSLQAFAFGTPGVDGRVTCSAVLVCADLLWWGPDLVASLTQRIAERYAIPPEAIVLHATHTHGAPQPGLTCSPLLGKGDPDYLDALQATVVDAVGRAIDRMVPVRLSRGVGTCRIGVNRRRARPDGWVLAPNPGGPVDPEVHVLRLSRVTGEGAHAEEAGSTEPHGSAASLTAESQGTMADETLAVLVHYTCHPTTSDAPQVSADYPGAMRDALRESLGEDVVISFLQGCCGDINPAVVRDGQFHRGGDAELAQLGSALAASVRDVLSGPMTDLPDGEVRVQTRTVDLPLATPSRDQLLALRDDEGIWGDWARHLLADPARLVDHVPLRLTLLSLSPELALLGFDAEVTVAYGFEVKRRSGSRVLPLPYTNGMVGYVVTDEQLRQGGYEPNESYPYIYRPGRWALGVEERVTAAVDAVLADL
ncbi:hypothetical protein [Thermasporomyces composti]|uniref:Neutral/alkaline ceramidase-like enzyme n=1 Tax=Thermasporomyces composti TaxID=696763 RepID=A0A3D9VGG4_THECX|nr:hypothetical protein [Thermasporomyces composti]REF36411.1 hypothetical protein DFJ64_1819 [Thermasporomyces composti]